MSGSDLAELGRLRELLVRLADGLETFLAFDEPDRSVIDRARWSAPLSGPVPETGVGVDAVLDELLTWVVPNGLRTPHPGFSGYILSRPTTAGIVAGTAATVAGHVRDFLSSFNHLEDVGLAWLAGVCGLRDHSGVFSGGGSTANLIALGAARQAAFEAIGVDPAAEGLHAGPRVSVYGSSEVHHTIHRAAAVLGLGRSAFVPVATDRCGRVDPDAVRDRIRADRAAGVLPVAIVAVAGTTSTGYIDPILALADVAAEEGVWLHVDGAYGLLARCLPELAELLDGVEQANSAIVDPHKWLGTPVGCGATYVRDGDLLERAFTQEPAAYLATYGTEEMTSQFDHLGRGWFDRSLELHAPSRGSWVWAVLREIGLEGVRARLRRHIAYASSLAEMVDTSPHLYVSVPPSLSICCFRHVAGDAHTTELLRRLRADTSYVPSTARIDGQLAIRACFVNPATTIADVEGLAEAASSIAAALAHE